MTQKLNAAGAKLRPRIKVVTQPAQSPDVNICDLAFFRALACALRNKVVNRFGSYPGKPGNHRVLALIGKTY